jgi:hypothetical protein
MPHLELIFLHSESADGCKPQARADSVAHAVRGRYKRLGSHRHGRSADRWKRCLRLVWLMYRRLEDVRTGATPRERKSWQTTGHPFRRRERSASGGTTKKRSWWRTHLLVTSSEFHCPLAQPRTGLSHACAPLQSGRLRAVDDARDITEESGF